MLVILAPLIKKRNLIDMIAMIENQTCFPRASVNQWGQLPVIWYLHVICDSLVIDARFCAT